MSIGNLFTLGGIVIAVLVFAAVLVTILANISMGGLHEKNLTKQQEKQIQQKPSSTTNQG